MTEILEKPGRVPKGRRPRQGSERTPAARVAEEHDKRMKQQGRGAARPLVVGGVPRVDLLPTEVLVDRRQRTVTRRAWLGVIVIGAVTVLGVTAATLTSMTSEQQLRVAQAQSTALLQQQGQFSEVRDVESRSDLVEAAQRVGGSTEIDWSDYLQAVQASLPAGVTISGIDVDSASPLTSFPQSTGALEGARSATLAFEADSPTLPSVPEWLESARELPGFVDANVTAVTLDETSGHYTVNMTVHIDARAFDGRYAEDAR